MFEYNYYTKENVMVKNALIIAEYLGYTSKDVDLFVADHRNLREVVKLCLEELEQQ